MLLLPLLQPLPARWVDERFVHVLTPNLYRTMGEAKEAFDYIANVRAPCRPPAAISRPAAHILRQAVAEQTFGRFTSSASNTSPAPLLLFRRGTLG